MKRIGRRMQDVVAVVSRNPGCPKLLPARAVAPNGSLYYGYQTVDRAIKAGLVKAESGKGGAYALCATEWLR